MILFVGIEVLVEYAFLRSKMEVVAGVMEDRGTVGEDGFMGLRVTCLVDAPPDVLVEAVALVLGFGRWGCGGLGSLGRMY